MHMVSHSLAIELQISLSYSGDSLAGHVAAPAKMMEAVGRWLNSQFNEVRWKNKGNSLPIGVQFDSNSCGICSINAIAHAVFQDPVWRHGQRGLERVQWFVILAEHHLRKVCSKRNVEAGALTNCILSSRAILHL